MRVGRTVSTLLGGATVLLGAALALPPELARADVPSFGVATESPRATQATSRVLAQGGNAVDAVVVAALVAGVTSPTSSGIGGGGFAVVHIAGSGAPYVLDFREVAPAGLDPAAFERRPLPPEEVGHLVGVPGEVRGLYELHAAHGSRDWKELVQIAANVATRGFSVSRHVAEMLAYARAKLAPRPGFSALFYPGGKPALVGSRITHPALGKTLERIAAEGPEAFYAGSVARSLVDTAQSVGSSMTLEDLARYRPVKRKPLSVRLADSTVYTMPPPSAGGLMMVQALQVLPLDLLERLGPTSPATAHLLAESMRASVADRMRYLSDPDHVEPHLDQLLAPSRMNRRRGMLSLERTHALPRFGLEEKGTHAVVVADRQGSVVSLTTTLNHLFGAKVLDTRTGVFLNNELDDFTSSKNVEAFGMRESPNQARPLARPVSSMTPTLVLNGQGEAILALGGSGGTAIATNALQTLLGALVFQRSAEEAVRADRIYLPTDHRSLLVEKGTTPDFVRDLEERGEVVDEMPFSGTAIQMLKRRAGRWTAAADPRKHGKAQTGR